MTARFIYSLAFDRIDGGLLAPDPSNYEMEQRVTPPDLLFLERFDVDIDSESGHLERVEGFDEAAAAKPGLPQLQLDLPDTEGAKGAPPKHCHNSIRVYVAHGKRLRTLIRNVLGHQDDHFQPSMGSSKEGYEGLSDQWEKIPKSWFAVPSFAISKPVEKPRWLLRVWRFKQFIASFRKITKEIYILEHEDDSLSRESSHLSLSTSSRHNS